MKYKKRRIKLEEYRGHEKKIFDVCQYRGCFNAPNPGNGKFCCREHSLYGMMPLSIVESDDLLERVEMLLKAG